MGQAYEAGRQEVGDGLYASLQRVSSSHGIAGAVKQGTDFDPDNIAELFRSANTDQRRERMDR
jgi:hypothetical protein